MFSGAKYLRKSGGVISGRYPMAAAAVQAAVGAQEAGVAGDLVEAALAAVVVAAAGLVVDFNFKGG